jgi:hypothetical protein
VPANVAATHGSCAGVNKNNVNTSDTIAALTWNSARA